MKFVTTKEKLGAAVRQVSAIVPKDSSIPILNSLLFEVSNGRLHVRGTNLQTTIISSCGVEVVEPGVAVVPAAKIGELIENMPDGEISFEVAIGEAKLSKKQSKSAIETRGIIKTGKSRFTMKCESAEEFPAISDAEWRFKFVYPCARFFDMLAAASIAVAKEDHRDVLKGVLLECTPDRLNVVATDGHRLLRMRDINFSGPSEVIRAVVPAELVKALKLIVDDFEIEVAIAEDKLSISNDRVKIITKLIAGKYPDYTRVWPQAFTRKLSMAHDELLASFRRMALFASDIDNKVRCSFDEQRLELMAQDGANIATENIPIPDNENPFKITYNDKYILSLLKSLRGERVTISFTESHGPTIFEPETQGEIEQHMFLMPLREDKLED